MSDSSRSSRVSVEWNFLKPDWHGGRRLFLSRYAMSWPATIFSMIFDKNETLAIGLKFTGLAASKPSPFSTGIKMDRFCDDGRIPSRIDLLHSIVKRGSKTSRSSWSKKLGIGSNSHDFGGDVMMRRRTSSVVTSFTVGRQQSVVG